MSHEATLRDVVLRGGKWLAYWEEINWAIDEIDRLRSKLADGAEDSEAASGWREGNVNGDDSNQAIQAANFQG